MTMDILKSCIILIRENLLIYKIKSLKETSLTSRAVIPASKGERTDPQLVMTADMPKR